MAERIPGARLVELPGAAHLPWEGDADALVDEVDRFVAGLGEHDEPDCVLSTLLRAEVDAPPPHADLAELAREPLARFRARTVEAGRTVVLALFDGPARAVRCATEIVTAAGHAGLHARAGLHTGEIAFVDGGVRGLAVQVVGQVLRSARPGEVLVSSTVKDILAGSQLAFEERDAVQHDPRVYALGG
jgi:class 3 adenylate cyclase